MIEVTVGQHNKIEGVPLDEIVPGDGVVSGMLGMNTGIDDEAEGTGFAERAICPDPTMGIQISKLHEWLGSKGNSSGISRRKGAIRT